MEGKIKALKEDLPPSPAPSSPRNGRKYAIETEIVNVDVEDQYRASSVPVYLSATFKQADANGQGPYDYTRSGNPTRTHLERHLAKIMGASMAFAVSSGMGALDVITKSLKPGDQVIAGDDLYGGTNRLLKYLIDNSHIIVHHVDTTNVAKVAAVVSDRTVMVLLETPTNPLIKIADIRSISTAVKQKAPDALIVVDNTMMSPLLQNPLELGTDIVYESATKFLSGHHDIMAGVIAVRDVKVGEKIFFAINATGVGLSPFDCSMLLKGIKTLSVRLCKQEENAQRIAEWLESHNFKTHYPGLRSHPQYKLHASQSRGSGAVLSFETGNIETSESIVSATRLWSISVSFGSVNSLISMPCKMSHASIDAATRAERALPEDLIRLCVGIENVNDLIADLEIAMVKSGAIEISE